MVDQITTTDTESIPEAIVAEPPMYQVILLNDDFTPMDFVIRILVELFYLSTCLLYTSPSPRDKRQSRMPSSA